MEKVCAAYLRVSTHDQEEYSPDSQLRLIREYAAKHHMALPDEYVYRDDGISGRSAEKRPDFMRMISRARQKPPAFSVILVWKFSRFARNQEESVVYKSLLKKEGGIEVISVSEPLLEGPFGGLVERIIEWSDAFYSANLSVEVRRGMEERLSRGLAISAPPLGYRYDNGRLAVKEEEAEIVRMIFRRFLQGSSPTALAHHLNSLGLRTKRGGRWEGRTVEYVLENPVYIGRLRRKKKGGEIIYVQGKHEPVISEEEFYLAQGAAKKGRPGERAPVSGKPGTSLLRGLVRCGSCNGILSPTGNGMNCSRYAHGRCGQSHYIKSEKLEGLLLAWVRLQVGSLPYSNYVNRESCLQARRTFVRMKGREEEALRRCREAYERGVDSLEEYRESKGECLKRLERLTEELSACDAGIRKAGEERDAVSQILSEKISNEEKSRLLHGLIDFVVYHKKEKRLELHLPIE